MDELFYIIGGPIAGICLCTLICLCFIASKQRRRRYAERIADEPLNNQIGSQNNYDSIKAQNQRESSRQYSMHGVSNNNGSYDDDDMDTVSVTATELVHTDVHDKRERELVLKAMRQMRG